MPAYCTQAQVEEHLDPSSVGTGDSQLTVAEVATIITEASGMVDDALPNYWQFPAVGSTPNTPVAIQKIAAKLAGALALTALGTANYGDPETARGIKLRTDAEEHLAKYRTGEYQVEHVQISNEAIDWEENDPIDTGTHDFAFGGVNAGQPYRVVETSVTITDNANVPATGYEYNVDYYVARVPRYGMKWCLIRLNSGITEGTDTVSYRFTYEKGDVEQTASRPVQFHCGRG